MGKRNAKVIMNDKIIFFILISWYLFYSGRLSSTTLPKTTTGKDSISAFE